MFWPLAAYGAATLVASASRSIRRVSFIDSKQLVLFAIVPIAYRLLRGRRALTAIDVIITAGAVSAVYGIVQFGILQFRQPGPARPGHARALHDLLRVCSCWSPASAAARVMFRRHDRLWAALVMPALLVALALTFSRNAWVGACAGIGLLFLLRDFRLVALVPVAAALFLAFAPGAITERAYSTFRMKLRRDSADRASVRRTSTGSR